MKKYIIHLFFACLITCQKNQAQNINVSGNISSNTTWSTSNIDTVKIVGNLIIDNAVTLTIEPGIVVDFTGYYYINVEGTLKAEGTITDSIKFTTSDNIGYDNNTHIGWGGIRIYNHLYSNDTTKISYCLIEYGKADGTSGLPGAGSGGGLYVYQSFKVVLNNSTIRRNYALTSGGGLYDYYSFVNNAENLRIKNCHFYSNNSAGAGGAIYSNRGIETYFDNCIFEHNKAQNGGAIFVDNHASSRLQVKNCRFSYNESNSAGGAIYGRSYIKGMITNCILNNNKAVAGNGGGIYVEGSAGVNLDIMNCVIVNNEAANFSGGGIYFYGAVSSFTGNNAILNNTIAHNLAYQGGGIYVYDTYSGGNDLYLNKTIFYNNESYDATNNDVYLYGITGSNQTRFYGCSFTTNLNNTTGNPNNQGSLLNTNPLFINPSSGIGYTYEGYVGKNWSLDYCNSPCIDATADLIACECFPETDIAGNPRKLNSLIDIGAYEHEGIITHPNHISSCPGNSVSFSIATNISSPYTVVWEYSQDNGVNFTPDLNYTGDNFQYYANFGDDGTVIRATVINGCRTIVSNTATITVYEQEIITANASATSVCPGQPVTITASGNNISVYFWDNGIQNGVPFTPTATTTYGGAAEDIYGCLTNPLDITITVLDTPSVVANADATEICNGEEVTLTGSGANTYIWSHSITDGIAFTPTSTETYNVTGYDANNCSANASITVQINQPSVTANASSLAICIGDAVTLTGGGADSYIWGGSVQDGVAFSPTATTTYTVTGTDSDNCTNMASVTITVHNLPTISISASNGIICEGSSTNLTGTGGISYLWNPGNLTGTTVNVSPTVNTTFSVLGTDVNNCSNTAIYDILINYAPDANIGPDSLWVCDGELLYFDVASWSGVATYTIATAFNNVTDNALQFTYNTSNPPTLVQCNLTGINGCTSQDIVYLNDNTIYNLTQDFPVINGTIVSFHALYIPDNVNELIWDFGDGSTATGIGMGQHTYTTDGEYEICLIAINDCDTATSCFTINIEYSSIQENDTQILFIVYPNPTTGLFTIGELNQSSEVFIYDAVGKLVFKQTNIITQTTIDISRLENGIYFIEVRDMSGQSIITKNKIMKVK